MVTRVGTSRIIRFVVAGGSTAVLFCVLLFVFVASGLAPFYASVLAYSLTFTVGYVAQRSWTFKAQNSHSHSLPRYFVLQLGCAFSSGVVAQIAVEYFGSSPVLAAIVTTGVAGGASYFGSIFWAFPKREGAALRQREKLRVSSSNCA